MRPISTSSAYLTTKNPDTNRVKQFSGPLMLIFVFTFLYQANQAFCSATGHGHYTTFDGEKYDFMGRCEYVLAKDTDNTFTVLVENKPCTNSVICTYAVRVKVKGLNIKIRREGRVQLAGVNIKLPYNSKGGKLLYKAIILCNGLTVRSLRT